MSGLVKDGIRLGFYAPREWDEELEKVARELKLTKSDILRLALREYLDRYKARVER